MYLFLNAPGKEGVPVITIKEVKVEVFPKFNYTLVKELVDNSDAQNLRIPF